MKKLLSIFGIMTFLLGATVVQATFKDVPKGNNSYEDVRFLEEQGIVGGSKFRPDDRISQAEFASWVLKNRGFWNTNYQPKTKRRFSDVSMAKNVYSAYIYYLVDLGVIPEPESGRKTKFDPGHTISKIDAIKWLFAVEGVRVPLYFEEDLYQATDVPISSKNAVYINKAIELDIIDPGNTMANFPIKRAEVAQLLRRISVTGPNIRINVLPRVDSDVVQQPNFDVLDETWNKIFSTYLKKDSLDKEALINGAIKGIVEELKDKNSDFTGPSEDSVLTVLDGQVEGIGAVLEFIDEKIIVVTPIVGSPAARAGILPNDVIIMVDDIDVTKLGFQEAVSYIRGKKGTTVIIKVKRESGTFSFNIVRDKIIVSTTNYTKTQDGIGIVEIRDFGATVDRDVADLFASFKTSPITGLVIDLRNNPGGYLDKAVDVAGHFLEKGKQVVTINYSEKKEILSSSGAGELANTKIVVLINKGSASASEILAGALQDYGLATIVGDQSYGKGTVQEVSQFQNGAVLKLTVAEWLTPKGQQIDQIGITPDVVVKITDSDRAAGVDTQLEAALAIIRK